jgi:acetamidase/formamidase
MARLTFEQVRYCNPICSHPPALTTAPGDTVVTRTVDGCGIDAQDSQVAHSGKPMTGAFEIEGAKPGDTLLASFDKPGPSRRRG